MTVFDPVYVPVGVAAPPLKFALDTPVSPRRSRIVFVYCIVFFVVVVVVSFCVDVVVVFVFKLNSWFSFRSAALAVSLKKS